MKKTKDILINTLRVTFGNCMSILSGVIVGFLIPKILPMSDYGFYKTFTLYTAYLGFFHLGITDGIVLRYGGKNYDELDRPRFRSYFRWYLIINCLFGALAVLAGAFVPDNKIRFILIMLGLDLICVNITTYYQQLSQITERFGEFSLRQTLYSAVNIAVVVVLFIMYRCGTEIKYEIYVASVVAINAAVALWYIFTYRSISIGKPLPLGDTSKDIKDLIRIGFPLLFANLCSSIIFTLDRQFVNVLFDTETYAVYAFAYNMLSLITVATSAVATVIYPYLKRVTAEEIKEYFGYLTGGVMAFVYGASALYFPLCLFVQWFLPNYVPSLPIFRIIFPGLAISCTVTVVFHNYYKVLGKNTEYFKKTLAVLAVSAAANAAAYLIFRSTYAISIASVVTMVFWYLFAERLFVREYRYDGKKNFAYLISMLLLFYAVTAIKSIPVGLVLYVLVYALVTVAFFFKDIKNIIKKRGNAEK